MSRLFETACFLEMLLAPKDVSQLSPKIAGKHRSTKHVGLLLDLSISFFRLKSLLVTSIRSDHLQGFHLLAQQATLQFDSKNCLDICSLDSDHSAKTI